MTNFQLKDHTVDQFVPLDPKTEQIGFFATEESFVFQTRDHDFDIVGATPETQTELRTSQVLSHQATGSLIPIPGNISPTEYMGATTYTVPKIIDPTFADFFAVDLQTNDFNALANATTVEQFAEDLFPNDDTDAKVATIFNGMQVLRIPANRFNTILTDPQEIENNNGSEIVENLGKYFIKVSPKFIETTIEQIDRGKHFRWDQLDTQIVGGIFEERRTRTLLSTAPFEGTPWDFEATPGQRGRLFGSVVEVWTADLKRLKQHRIVGEHALNVTSTTTDVSAFILYPNIKGYDPAADIPTVGDVVRVYPRESYFKPIYIDVDYIGANNDILSLVRFMKNDVARNLDNGVFEIYDDSGIQIDEDGNLSGTVTQSYQISKEGNFEVRRRLDIPSGTGNQPQ